MTKNRLEAFSDGVLAIIITIMVLELKIPEHADFAALKPLFPKFLSYIFSFLYVGIYWNNHHHLFHAVKKINGNTLWANLLLLFFLSLTPFTTAWMGENNFAEHPVALYGINLLGCAVAFLILEKALLKEKEENKTLSKAVTTLLKERLSMLLYAVGIVVAFYVPVVGVILFYVVALMWFIPDKRIERTLQEGA